MTTFRTSRTFHASPKDVFAALQDPQRLARWWGPSGFTNVFDVFDFRPGGAWVFTMIGPDGTRYANESVFKAIEPYQRVVIEHVCPPRFALTITLTPIDSGTRLVWEQAFEDAALAESVRHIVEPANEQNLDRLSAELSA